MKRLAAAALVVLAAFTGSATAQAPLTPADSAILASQPLRLLVLAPSLVRRLSLLAAGLNREVVLCLQGTVSGDTAIAGGFVMPDILTSAADAVAPQPCGPTTLAVWHNHLWSGPDSSFGVKVPEDLCSLSARPADGGRGFDPVRGRERRPHPTIDPVLVAAGAGGGEPAGEVPTPVSTAVDGTPGPPGRRGPVACDAPIGVRALNARPPAHREALTSLLTARWGRCPDRRLLLHRAHHVEDRQVHGDHHAAHDDAQDDDHDRLHQREQRAHRGIDLVIIEVRDL